MSKCPFCEADIFLEEFFHTTIKETKKGKIKKKTGEFKGESMSLGYRHGVKMWTCPSCDKILGFSEYMWNTA